MSRIVEKAALAAEHDYDVATAVLDAVADDLRSEGARAVLAAVEALHRRLPTNWRDLCCACEHPTRWPCPTLTAAREAAGREAALRKERDEAQEHIAKWLGDNAPEPDGNAGTLTGDLAVDMAHYATRLKARAENAEAQVQRVRELADPDYPPPPPDERGAAGWRFAMEHIRAALDGSAS